MLSKPRTERHIKGGPREITRIMTEDWLGEMKQVVLPQHSHSAFIGAVSVGNLNVALEKYWNRYLHISGVLRKIFKSEQVFNNRHRIG